MISVLLAAASRYIFLIHYSHYTLPYPPFLRKFFVMFFDLGRDAAGLVRFEAFKSGVGNCSRQVFLPRIFVFLLFSHLHHHE